MIIRRIALIIITTIIILIIIAIIMTKIINICRWLPPMKTFPPKTRGNLSGDNSLNKIKRNLLHKSRSLSPRNRPPSPKIWSISPKNRSLRPKTCNENLAVDNISSETDTNEEKDFKILSDKHVDLTINTAKEFLELEPRKLRARHMSMFDFKTQFNEGKRTKSPKKIENLHDLSRRGRNFTKDLTDRSRASSRASAASRYLI